MRQCGNDGSAAVRFRPAQKHSECLPARRNAWRAFLHCRIAAFSNCRIATLPHCQIASLPHCLRYWIMPTPTPWMATGHAFRREPKPFDDAVFAKGLDAIL